MRYFNIAVAVVCDGKQVFYSKSEMVWDKNDYKTTYYMASAEDGEAIQYIGGGRRWRLSVFARWSLYVFDP